MGQAIELPQIDSSAIQWTGSTWNPWQGCIKVSAGCKFCYMYREKKRYGQNPAVVVRSADATFNKPLKWQREVDAGKRTGQDRLVFTCSWSDWFIEQADEWRDAAWDIVRACQDLIFQILTKRPERITDHLPAFWDEIAARCWIGTSVEDQGVADSRIPILLKVPAPIRFLSCEPLLSSMDIGPYLSDLEGGLGVQMFDGISWVIVGGESGGDEARHCNVTLVRAIVDQCRASSVPVFVKQLGTHPFTDQQQADPSKRFPVKGHWTDGVFRPMLKDGKGGDMAEWPSDIRVREFPVKL